MWHSIRSCCWFLPKFSWRDRMWPVCVQAALLLLRVKQGLEVEPGQLGLWTILFCRFCLYFIFWFHWISHKSVNSSQKFLHFLLSWKQVSSGLKLSPQCRESYIPQCPNRTLNWKCLFLSACPVFLHISHGLSPPPEKGQVRVDTGFVWAFTQPDSTYNLIASSSPHRWGGIPTLEL